MKPRTMVAINVAGTLALSSAFYWWGPDHSLLTLVQWVVLLGSALLMPMYLSSKVDAELARLAAPVPNGLRRAAVYPVWVGMTTLLAAAGLILGPR